MELPNFFTDKNTLLTYNYNNLKQILNTDIDNYYRIDNLSIDNKDHNTLCINYFKSILLGYNHIFITKLLKDNLNLNSNISLPLLNDWNGNLSIDNLVVISNPNDSERICKSHVKKAPIFKNLLKTSIISTTDNDDWKNQRQDMNIAFMPKLSLSQVFSISSDRANESHIILKNISNNFSEEVNISDFFLNETQSQLQLAMFGFSNEFEKKTNKKLREAFSGINTDYIEVFCKESIKEMSKSVGPLSQVIQESSKDLEQLIGNIIIFSFAGHDTTGHTLTWLIYELCKNPKYKQKLIQEIDNYWNNNTEATYDTLDQLPFMTKCITETLRLWPALANGTYRELEKDEYITGHDGEKVELKQGTYCQIINWTRHRNPDLWGDDVNEFNPDRIFKDEEIWDYKGFGTTHISSERFSPFTYGPRHCIGKNFSQMEMRLILLNIFKYYDFELTDEQKKTIHDPNYLGINTFTMGPSNINKNNELLGMYVHIIPRYSKL